MVLITDCFFCFLKVQDVGAEKDAVTSLRAPTHYGKPNWDRMFPSIVESHPETDVGVVSPVVMVEMMMVFLINLIFFFFF